MECQLIIHESRRKQEAFMETEKREKKGSRKKIVIVLAVFLVVVMAAAGVLWHRKSAGNAADAVYVDTVANITGTGALTSGNRFAGVIESQKSWSVNTDSDNTVKEVLVQVGDEVQVGTPLFIYDTDKLSDSLTQAQIDMQRLVNEQNSIASTITELTKEKASASSAEQADYTIQIQEQQLSAQQKALDIQSKQTEIDTLTARIQNATVTSEIEGVVKSINNTQDTDTSGNDSTDSAFMTIMQTGNLQVKGTVNEQNIGELTEGMPVIVHSRVDAKQTWKGTISKIDQDNAQTNQNSSYFGSSDSADTSSSSYPFYVTLESSEGLIIGQHVYLEEDNGEQETQSGICLSSMYIVGADGDAPYVWADNGKGKLEKRKVTLGAYDEDGMTYVIEDGLSLEDLLAFPDDSLKENMPTTTALSVEEGTDEESGSLENAGGETEVTP